MTFSNPPDVLPSNAVMPFFGKVSDVPEGWVVCDGNNGTDDLRDKYILAVSSSTDTVGATGGANNIQLSTSQIPPHTHPGSTSSDGEHDHTFTRMGGYNLSWDGSGRYETDSGTSDRTEYNGSHTHSNLSLGNAGQLSPSSTDNEPLYYETIFIQKL